MGGAAREVKLQLLELEVARLWKLLLTLAAAYACASGAPYVGVNNSNQPICRSRAPQQRSPAAKTPRVSTAAAMATHFNFPSTGGRARRRPRLSENERREDTHTLTHTALIGWLTEQ